MTLLIVIIAVIILLLIICIRNNTSSEKFVGPLQQKVTEKYFNQAIFAQLYNLVGRKRYYQNSLKPDIYYYKYQKMDLTDSMDNNKGNLKLLHYIRPNFDLKFNIPQDEIFNKCYLKYKLNIKGENNPKYENFIFFKYFTLSEWNSTQNISKNIKDKFLKFESDIFKGDSNSYQKHDNYKIFFEVPTRLTGDTRDENNNINCELLLFFYQYKLTIEVYCPESITDKLKQIKPTLTKFNADDIKLTDAKFVTNPKESKEINTVGYIHLKYLLDRLDQILKIDPIQYKGIQDNEYYLYEYKKEGFYHGKKIDVIIKVILFFIEKKIEECVSMKPDTTFSKEDLVLMEELMNLYYNESSGNYDYYSGPQSYLEILFGEDKVIENELKEENKKNYLITLRPHGEELMAVYEKLSDTVKTTSKSIVVSSKINELSPKLVEKKSIDLNKYEISYEFDLSEHKPEEPKPEPLPPTISEEEKEENFINKLGNYQKILYLFQSDIQKLLRNRHVKYEGNNFLSDRSKSFILDIKNKTKSKNQGEKIHANKTLKFIQTLLNGIKSGKLSIMKKIINTEVHPLTDVFPLRNFIESEITQGPSEGFVGGYSNPYKYGEDYKKNMNDIYKRFKKYKMEHLDKHIEHFTQPNELHQHSKAGQVNFLRGENIMSSHDFEKEEWLRQDENQRMLSNYKFLSEGNKKGILKEMDNMEQKLYNLKEFTDTNYSTVKEKIDMIDAKANEELNRQQQEENMTESEKNMRDFLEKEKEQEAIIKRMNEKMSGLEKEQKGLNLSRFDQINSIQSLGDGHTLSVINQKDNIYQIKGNQGCIQYQKKNDKYILDSDSCAIKKNQQFQMQKINNMEEYNQHLNRKVDDFSEVLYPFNIITPSGINGKCVSLQGNKMSLLNCADSKYHRFETSRTYKKCDSNYGN